MVTALQPIREKFGLNRIIVSTYQAVSGAGAEAIDELETKVLNLKRANGGGNFTDLHLQRRIIRLLSMRFLKSMHLIHRAIHLKS